MSSQIQVSVSSFLTDHPDISDLAKDFALYKETGIPPLHFGRDGDNNRPTICKEENVWHIHLAHLPIHFTKWPKIRNQQARTSDKCLIYCPGYFNENHYLLIAILDPPAHEKQEDMPLMEQIGREAEAFRREI
ncbi:toxin YafO [Marinomonas sp. A3A]|uniref:type II toxin-antitoxin system YafO family toxin n=1 Tax=Marinomonas sp. A3A TaxID=2065312 RepID=UPI001BB3229C|nr:type II toxin-antitoxin system YafO family toxin [Marinomonas sp. A3A]QUX92067.1 toxin YafO [Marinomonas sp. A3A]